MKMDPAKVAVVKEWKELTNKKEVQSFLGFCNFYQRFIRGFAGVAKLLTLLTGKGKWVWGEEQHEAFEELKRRMTEEPVLIVPHDDGKF